MGTTVNMPPFMASSPLSWQSDTRSFADFNSKRNSIYFPNQMFSFSFIGMCALRNTANPTHNGNTQVYNHGSFFSDVAAVIQARLGTRNIDFGVNRQVMAVVYK
jgi:hypothetical protein